MRKDIKTGMLAGTVLCLIAVVWFCAKQQIASRPPMKFESPNLTENETIEAENVDLPASTSSEEPVVPEKPAEVSNVPAYEPIQQQSQKGEKPDIIENFIIHTVTGGQTLSDISKIYYDTPGKWKKIYEANKEQFPKGPDTIMPGMKLIIPQ
jgi:hypothetical protein